MRQSGAVVEESRRRSCRGPRPLLPAVDDPNLVAQSANRSDRCELVTQASSTAMDRSGTRQRSWHVPRGTTASPSIAPEGKMKTPPVLCLAQPVTGAEAEQRRPSGVLSLLMAFFSFLVIASDHSADLSSIARIAWLMLSATLCCLTAENFRSFAMSAERIQNVKGSVP